MMKKLFFWLVFLSVGMQAQNVTFADANFKQALVGGIAAQNNFVIGYDQNGTNILIDQNQDGEIQLSEAALVYRIDFRQISNYTTLEGINSFVNLESIYYINDGMSSHIHGKIGDISLDGLNNFKTFNLSGCDIGKVNIKNCPNLLEIKSAYTDSYNDSDFNIHGDTQTLTIDNCPQVKTIVWTNNNLAVSNITNCPSLTKLELRGNSLVTFDASPLANLEYLDVSNNQQTGGGYSSGEANFNPSLTSLNINGLSKLEYLNASNQLLTNLDLSQLPVLNLLNCRNNKITTLNVQTTPNLKYLNASVNLLTNQGIDWTKMNIYQLYLDLSYNALSSEIIVDSPINNFNYINLSHNLITKFVVNSSFFANYYSDSQARLDLSNNLIEGLIFTTSNFIYSIDLSNNPIRNLDSSSLTVNYLIAENTSLSNINLKGIGGISYTNSSAETLKIKANHILAYMDEWIQIADNPNLREIDFSEMKSINGSYSSRQINNNPNLIYINFKNGNSDRYDQIGWSQLNGNDKLKYICCDTEESTQFQNVINSVGLQSQCSINTYCSFTPGGNHNTISGTVRFDSNNNGCDASDNAFEFLKLKINDGTNSGETFAQNNGKYEFYTQAGNFNIAALAENPTLFTVSPANFSANFADANNNIFTQDICVTANGNQNDAEVVIAPLTNARPGFDATYKLVWRNKGNTTLSGKVVLNYDASKMTFQNSSLPYSVASNGTLEFDYANLKPFENTASEIIFTINTPTNSINPVNSGDVLAFNAQITPNSSDLTPEDNNFGFNHTVVNSFDPNDIVCLEGETIPSVAVGKYLHYVVNFENTGTAEAENIVVKMQVDPAEFDINTLQLQNASGNVETRITGDQVEFIFKKIKLQSGGHGNVLLKMRSKSDLVEGDTVNNIADIYFDYNFPIETNDYVTTINDASSMLAAKLNYTASDFSQNNYKINFDASLSTGTITNYQWEFSGNPSISSSTDVKPVVTYTVPGNYNAKLTVFDSTNASSSQSITFNVGGNVADLSTGKNSDNNFIAIDSDDDDWKGYDINGTQITPKVRQTYTGWSFADIGNGNNSQWISLNNFEGYYTYKSRDFIIPDNATDAKLNLRSLSFVRNWTYLVKVNPDGSEDETEITKTQWMSDGFKGWLNSRSPKVDNYSLSAGRYYIKVLVYSNNAAVRQSLDVNAIVSCSTGLMYSNKLVYKSPTLDVQNSKDSEVKIYPIPTKGLINIVSQEKVNTVEIYDVAGRIIQKQLYTGPSKELKININAPKGIYYLKIKTSKETSLKKIIKD